jgi:hypothetical protein
LLEKRCDNVTVRTPIKRPITFLMGLNLYADKL